MKPHSTDAQTCTKRDSAGGAQVHNPNEGVTAKSQTAVQRGGVCKFFLLAGEFQS